MNDVGGERRRWHPLSVLGVAGGRITIENPLLGLRLSASADAMADLLLDEGGAEPGPLMRALSERGILGPAGATAVDGLMADWVELGWGRSLEYFLWSERAEFTDWDDADDSVRNAVAAEVNRTGGAPPRHHPPADRVVRLESPGLPDVPVGELLLARRTHRYFDEKPASLAELTAVIGTGLHSVRATRLRARRVGGPEGLLETHGVTFDTYVIAYGVDDLEPGVWAVDPEKQVLNRTVAGDFRTAMSDIMCGMPATLSAAATIVLVADFRQLQHRYRHERALRSVYIEAGQIAQLIILASEAIGFGALITPATNDGQLASLLQLPGARFAPVYTVTVGRKPAPAVGRS